MIYRCTRRVITISTDFIHAPTAPDEYIFKNSRYHARTCVNQPRPVLWDRWLLDDELSVLMAAQQQGVLCELVLCVQLVK